MEYYYLLIVYENGNIMTVVGVEDYGRCTDSDMFYFVKDGCKNFVPSNNVLYFGQFHEKMVFKKAILNKLKW